MNLVLYKDHGTSVLGKPLSPKGLLDLNGRILLEVLTTMGARSAVVSNSGEGDDGGIDEVMVDPSGIDLQIEIAMLHEAATYHQATGWHRRQDFKPMAIEDALAEFADLVIEAYHGGYENNDGGRGEVNR